ncbi:MAG: sensor histidine kinase [Firmicutes bacterium HGW-Firmicutes-11]|jgi:two-component system sensor histidine kinase LytS|nr:MAG: sensor histidine kinase [Firmicutes bacterium HGW-Firmicutes-11]
MNSLLWDMALNVGMLALIASLLTKIKIVQTILIEKKGSLGGKTVLAVIFGLICIFSTYSGIHLDGVIVNTRVIGALAAGIIGGPYVGIGAGLIGGLHRYFYNIEGFTSVACALSTFAAGIMGGIIYPYFQRGKWNITLLFAATAFAEAFHMVMILLIPKPFEVAVQTVQIIALPMILLNSFGMLIFISTFKNVFHDKDQESESKLRLALSVAEQCLPFFRKGLSNKDDLTSAVSIILSSTMFSGVIITDRQQIMAMDQTDPRISKEYETSYLNIAKKAMQERRLVTVSDMADAHPLAPLLKYHSIIAAPLIQMEQPAGCLIVFVKRRWLRLEADISFVGGLATLFSTQLELGEVDYQKRLRQKAELYALQSQVNPHFLYNSLNTLSCICRESPSRARKLLMTMATYYRQTLDSNRHMISLKEEIEQVNNYLLLEKARFEDRLSVTLDIPEDLDCLVPTLILQPIVENAVKYGVDDNGYRKIIISAYQTPEEVAITVTDCGPGFHPDALNEIYSESSSSNHIGLVNVNRRLKSIYGEDSGLSITCTPQGSEVRLRIVNNFENHLLTARKEPA